MPAVDEAGMGMGEQELLLARPMVTGTGCGPAERSQEGWLSWKSYCAVSCTSGSPTRNLIIPPLRRKPSLAAGCAQLPALFIEPLSVTVALLSMPRDNPGIDGNTPFLKDRAMTSTLHQHLMGSEPPLAPSKFQDRFSEHFWLRTSSAKSPSQNSCSAKILGKPRQNSCSARILGKNHWVFRGNMV